MLMMPTQQGTERLWREKFRRSKILVGADVFSDRLESIACE